MNVLVVANDLSWQVTELVLCLNTMGHGTVFVMDTEEAIVSVHVGNPQPQVVVAYSEDLDVAKLVKKVREHDIFMPIVILAWPWERINGLPEWINVVEMDENHMDYVAIVAKISGVFQAKSLRHE